MHRVLHMQKRRRNRANPGMWHIPEHSDMMDTCWVRYRAKDGQVSWRECHRSAAIIGTMLGLSTPLDDGTPAVVVEASIGDRHRLEIRQRVQDTLVTTTVTVDVGLQELECDCGDKHEWTKPCRYTGAAMRHLGLLRTNRDLRQAGWQ